MKKASFSLLLLFLIMSSLIAQNPANKPSVTGSWLGKLHVSGIELRLIFNLKLNDRDSLIATLDSPDQGAKNIPLGKVITDGNNLTIQAPALQGEYKGVIASDTTIAGKWSQAGATFDLDLKKIFTTFVLNRPQEPKGPFPYSEENVIFHNEKFNIDLAGTLTIPEGTGPFKAVIMVTGSGAQNRNEELMGHKPFLVIADYLSRHGIAVLRYDDRGVGGSQGNYAEATSADLSTDGEAAIAFLRKNPKIIPGMIGIIGHSEGGLIAPIISSADRGIGFIVTLAGPGVNGEKIILRQSADIMRLSGASESDINEANETNKIIFSILKQEKDNNSAQEKMKNTLTEILKKKNLSDEEIQKSVSASLRPGTYTWLRYFIITDPAPFWKKVKCPVLALNGDKDVQVAADENLSAIEKALKGNKSVRIVKLPGLNHLFQHCTTGLPIEYNTIEETFSPDVLKIISDWIAALPGK